MKHIIICIIASAYFFAGCNNNTPKDVDHEHQQNEVDTDHEHEDEIIFTEEKAQAAYRKYSPKLSEMSLKHPDKFLLHKETI